jgi:branched-chain amino acid transport system ATP-binding protein
MSVVFVEHDMDVVYDISDWVIVLGNGSVIAEGPPSVIGTNPVVIDAYLGRQHDAPTTRAEEEQRLAAAEQALLEEIQDD